MHETLPGSGCPMAKVNSAKRRVLEYLRGRIKQKYPGADKERIFHAKSLGLAEAKLIVYKHRDPSLKLGLFDAEREYKAWVRFSNASPNKKNADSKGGVRGMAIKILLPPDLNFRNDRGEIQIAHDIILSNDPIFIPGVGCTALNGVKAALGNPLMKFFNFIIVAAENTWNRSLNGFVKGLKIFIRAIGFKTPNLLEEMYFSATPYRFGSDKLIKWQALPLKTVTSSFPKTGR